MARACGSYPQCPRFESRCRYHQGAAFDCAFLWPVGQVVKTPPFHGGNMGSSPVRVTTSEQSKLCSDFLFSNSLRYKSHYSPKAPDGESGAFYQSVSAVSSPVSQECQDIPKLRNAGYAPGPGGGQTGSG